MKTIIPYSLEAEKKVREFWEKNKIPLKVRSQNKGKKKFYFMDGPPYASGHIHMGTALNKTLKDIAMRSKRMQGFDVADQPGYDTHGLPIENKVESKLGFKNKKQIEEYGVEKFVNECKAFATEFIDVMNEEFYDLGVWMDWDKPYLTLDNQYIEGLWWTFKRAFDQGLLYLGKYSVHVCPRCETAVAYNEIEYVKQTDDSVYIKFPVLGEKNKFLVIWTTTPWTLPGNAGVMVNPVFDYVELKAKNETWIVAKELAGKISGLVKEDLKVVKEFKGKKLEGMKYSNPLSNHLALGKLDNAYRVIMSDKYVTLTEGTGLVHTAPGHGKEDFEEGTKAGLPVISAVELNGVFNKLGGKYAGKKVRDTNPEIIKDLEALGALVLLEKYKHDYPVCWRCKTPLLMIASPQWFFAITGMREKLKQLNEEVTWVPYYGKSRFANWLDSLGDWPVSRQRYWGTPLPIWICNKCEKQTVVGSLKELQSLSGVKGHIDLHKPWIDRVTFKCSCGGESRRVPEVLDVWFDSGTSSWSSLGYPERKDLFEKFWPADLNIEGKDQIRGWWNSQLITSTISFGKKPFNTIVMHGLVLDVNKNKMSKSLGNIITPKEAIEKQNRDYLRHFLAFESRGEDFSFDWNAFKDIHRFYNTFFNVTNFLYGSIENVSVFGEQRAVFPKRVPVSFEPEDKWLLSRLNSVIEECVQNYNEYNFSKILSILDNFLLEEVSRTYIQIIRGRVGTPNERGVAFALREVVFSMLGLLSPIAPHLSEHFFQQVKEKNMPESVHLMLLPQAKKQYVDKALEKEIAGAKEIAQATLNLREELKLRRRWPLRKLVVKTKTGKEFSHALGIIGSLSNIQKVEETASEHSGNFAKKESEAFVLFLDNNADSALRGEWELMELRRLIQDQRKQAGLRQGEKARLLLGSSDWAFVEKFKKEIESETNSSIKKSDGKLELLLERSFYVKIEK